MPSLLAICEEVADALRDGRPIVALESTVIAHGLPRPQNLELALRLESIVRQGGAIPATVALLDGAICIGLNQEQLERISSSESVAKVSRRDLAAVLTDGRLGATTVAGTMACASMAGIRIMATGGIGGVHRDGENSLDISADLTELSQTPMAVVCAGAKSILDIGRTLQVLESLGVPVVGYQTDRFPAFYSPDSGHEVPHRVDTAERAAALLRRHWELGVPQGVLLALPIPEAHALPSAEIEAHIQDALRAATQQNLSGAQLTPFMLQHLARVSGNRSMQANLALLEHNATLAAEISALLT